MKSLRKMFALVIAMVMVLGMSTMAMAAQDNTRVVNTNNQTTNFTITVSKDATDKVAHTYGAFQLFKGDLAETYTEGEGGAETLTNKVLSNIQWGDSIDSTKIAQLRTDLDAIEGITVAADADAAAVAKAISDANITTFDDAKAQAIADAFNKALGTVKATQNTPNGDGKYVLTVPAGYYLVKDTADVNGEGAETRFILQVVSNVEPVEKADVPSITKKVKEKNDTTGEETTWQDAADYDIGDTIPYQITGTLPGRFDEYDTYTTYTITDTLSKGLTAPSADTITIKVGDKSVKDHFKITITGEAKAEQTIKIELNTDEDMKTWTDPVLSKDSKIVVEYNATLNDAAVIGTPGNPNDVDLEFSNNPNYDGKGDTGTTPKDKVVVFTYEIEAKKVGEDKTTALEGAGFTLYKKVPTGTTGAVDGYLKIGDEIKGVTTFEFKGTDAGEYKLVETTVPAGYNKADDITFTVEATYDTEADEPELKTLVVNPSTAGFAFTTTKKADDTHITTDGIARGNVVNYKGSVLPSTGGIGTTIFYVIGAILVLGAGILLVSKRRMSAN